MKRARPHLAPILSIGVLTRHLHGAGSALFTSGAARISARYKHDQKSKGGKPKKNLTVTTPIIPIESRASLSVMVFS